ncbi:MAG TPA: LysR family transcriptional regulator [Dongiaceae bacterium]
MDRLTSLTTFAQVVESGGFSAAARRLNMSTTMVSNHIQALEDRLGARLLNRTTRKISLTDVGAGYYERCARILAELEEADGMAGALQSTPRGVLKVYTNTHILRFVAPIISEYCGLYPTVTVDVSMGERSVDQVEERIDVVIRATPAPDSSLIAKRLTKWRHILCCSPRYLETLGMPETLGELARRNCMRYALYPFGNEWRFIGPDGKAAGVTVSGNLVSNSAEALRQTALDGHAIFLAPDFYVFEDIAAGRLVPVLPQYQTIEFAVNAIYPNRENLPAKVRTFIDLLAERISEHWAVIGESLRVAPR